VTSGKAVLIYLSGRSVTVEARSIHKVTMGDAKQSDLIGRVVNTLAEIAGPQTDSDRPVVHGMARDLSGVSGALPVNSRLFNPNFKFSWDPLEDVGEYEFKLEDAHGNVLGERTVNKTEIAASEFVLELGKRYVWSVQEAGSLLPRRSGKGWVEIAEKKESEQLALTLAEIEKKSAKTNKELLKAVSLYEGSYNSPTSRWRGGIGSRWRKVPKRQEEVRQGLLKRNK
jgi:hypothetical protein